MARQGMAGLGMTRQGWARQGRDALITHGMARHGEVGCGMA